MFEQWLVYEADDVVVTLLERAELVTPLCVADTPILEPGAPVVWFTFPGQGHDLGRFHLRDGTFTGLYANLLTPVVFEDRLRWRTTDLFLDVWLGRAGGFEVLDAAELAAALAQGSVSEEQARSARVELERMRAAWQQGSWPPQIVWEWTLERARTAIA